MILLSPFVTLLRADTEQGTVIHAPLWPAAGDAQDIMLDLPACLTDSVTVPGLSGMTIEPGPGDGLVYVAREGRDLCVHPAQRAAFLRGHGEGRFPFLIVADTALAALRDILAHRWRFESGEVCTAFPLEPFLLDFGHVSVDLARFMPVQDEAREDGYTLPAPSSPIVVRRGDKHGPEILLRQRTATWNLPHAQTNAALLEAPQARFLPDAETEMLALPITVCAEDHAWLHDKPYGGVGQLVGRHRCHPWIIRERDKFVMLARHTEGGIFDEHGVFTDTGYYRHLGTGGERHLAMPPGMRCDGDRLFVDRAALDRAPRLAGPHIVFTMPHLANYAHWLIDCILPLTLLVAHAPADAKIILPATLRGFGNHPMRICDHHDILRVLGLSTLPSVEVTEPFVLAEDVMWVEHPFIHNMPGVCLRDLRDIVMPKPAPSRDLNIYIARRGSRKVQNAPQIERFLHQRGFTIMAVDDMSFQQQIDAFSRAAWVVAPHGAELGNLLFCQPGTRVLELSPEIDYKPYFSYVCNKLGLTHGVLPCATRDGTFGGDMEVDMGKFVALYRMMRNHL